jgi:hypothetical protein
MTDADLRKLRREVRDPVLSVRLRAIDALSQKRGRNIVLTVDDERVVPVLIEALSDRDRRVQRAAARGLRPWVRARPDLLPAVLPHYTTNSFSGGYTHVGLYDVAEKRLLVPRFAAAKGHASLLSDGNTDRYLKFEFYLPSQAPRRFAVHDAARADAHLVFHFILDWSYSRQCRISPFDERRLAANAREQERYAAAVMRCYRESRLAHGVLVHHLVWAAAERPSYEFCAGRIPPCSGKGRPRGRT